jgi:hypothetical protein
LDSAALPEELFQSLIIAFQKLEAIISCIKGRNAHPDQAKTPQRAFSSQHIFFLSIMEGTLPLGQQARAGQLA